MPSLDREEFLAWKDSLLTREVFRRLQERATQEIRVLQDQLLALATYQPAQWAQEQPMAAYNRGRCERTVEIANLEYDELLTEDEAAALKEAEEKAKQ